MQLSKILFVFTVGLFVSLSLMLFDSFGKLSWLRGGIETLAGPELKTALLISGKYNSLRQAVRSALGKNQESKNILNKLAGLEENSLEIEKLRQENESLRKILGAEKISGLKLEPAEILSFSSQSLIVKKSLVIPGQAAVSPEMAILGIAGNSGKWNSSVKLLTDQSVKISVKILLPDQTPAVGEAIGEFGGRIVLEKVLTSVELQGGRPVFTSGTDGLPPDLLVGWVGDEIRKAESAVYQKAYIQPAVDFAGLNTIFFISNE
ncbi:rod shape-determining protein MreC [Candidatus Collierbacteria bacterium]|nr:rod shape-determining protein MreC [Candidatus Collierbacteria bacterium]